LELENFVLKVGLARRGTRGPGRPESAPLKDFGGRLYSAVFQDELRDVLMRSLSQTRAQHVGMRLRLRLAEAPELAGLPWEFLYDPRLNRFLAQSRYTPLVRYLDLPDPPRPLSVRGPLRLLVMISSPAGYPELDAEQEWNLLTGALADQRQVGRVIVERLPATMSDLRRRLRQEEFHIVHFVGHGLYRPDWADGVLVMEDRNGQPSEVTGEELGGLLSEYDTIRLAVLNACEGARSGASDPFSGMAQSLIQQGLPAVVAMQFEITDDAAIVFAHELYGAIADGYPLEAALAEARGAIRDEGNLTEWGTPVLYSRAPDGHLFRPTTQAPIPEAKRKAREEADRHARGKVGTAEEEGEHKAHQEAERKAHQVAEPEARQEAERKPRQEAEPEARQEAEPEARQEAERKPRQEAEPEAQQEAERKPRQEEAWYQDFELTELTRQARSTGEAGNPAGARDQLAALLPTYERVRGAEHPDTLATRAGLAAWTGRAGDPAGARDQLAALLPIEERVLGTEHPDTLTARGALAYWTGKAGDPAGARDQLAALLPIRKRVLGARHPDTRATRGGLAFWTDQSRRQRWRL